ncbi:MAG: nucleotidyl transferase AbiEii/AbiGii toxin family protein [Bacillota bacterium]
MDWDDILARSASTGAAPDLIFREEVQKAVLACLSLQEFFSQAVLQGGTALRLFYGNPRFSEDLDFVRKEPGQPATLTAHTAQIGPFLERQFSFIDKAEAVIQKQTATLERISVRLRGTDPSANLRLNLELAAVPSRSNAPKILRYPPINPAVRVESPSEILADKVTALLFRPYLKGRDVWDLHYLLEEHKLTIDWIMVAQKAEDYGHQTADLDMRMGSASRRLAAEGPSALAQEMPRFLTPATLQQYAAVFPAMAAATARRITKFQQGRERGLGL